MAFTTITVNASYVQQDGQTPATGTVTFLLTATMRDTDSNTSVVPYEIVETLDDNGEISVDLIATNGEYTIPRGVTYEVTERIGDGNENKYFISVNENSPSGILNLADVAPNITTVITQNYATKEYVDTLLAGADSIAFTPTDEITSTNVQDAIEEVRDKSKYVHTQSSAQTTWTITHNLQFYPSVTIVDSGGNYVIGDVQYTTLNALIVTFAHSFAGKAYLS